jgi:catechol 2,3-dioxygenase-like lactoylglutathione lyase family enzyme
MKLNHVAVNVSNRERSIQFYSNAFGLEVVTTIELAGAALEGTMRVPPGTTARSAFLAAGDGATQVELIEWQPASTAEASRPATTGLLLLSFRTDPQTLQQLPSVITAAGGRCPSSIETTVIGPRTVHVLVAEDPDGNLVEISASARTSKAVVTDNDNSGEAT